MKFTAIIFSIIWVIQWPVLCAQDDPEDPFDWRAELEDSDFDKEDPLEEYEWKDWGEDDWKGKFKEYEDYYKENKAQEIRKQAYEQAEQEGINMPQRHGPFTYDPETGEVVLESEEAYLDKLNEYLDSLEDELTGVAKDAALEALYLAVEPILKALKEKNSALLDAIIPQFNGIPAWDPIEENQKDKKEGSRNFKYWVKLAAENIMQNLFKKNAEGKWKLQRENVRLLQEVGVVRFLKMSVLDWELARSLELEIPDEILTYAEGLRDVYQSGKSTFEAGKELYREVSTLDTELPLPTSLAQLEEIGTNMVINQLTLQEMVKKRQKVLALTYRQLAERYQDYGQDLNDKLRQDDVLRMTDGERIKAHHIAQHYIQQSVELKAHAEQLLELHAKPHDPKHKEEVLALYRTYHQVKAQFDHE